MIALAVLTVAATTERAAPSRWSALEGLDGALLGIAVTTGYAAYQDWPAVVPLWATLGAWRPR
ncbi:hypothetical protein [Catellatospora vulcania]|uniref:hypothetical protein n=1 Tax=Catellatospora vulcania TaxID=1460450 RepID=UPI002E7BA4B7|nr:hypothetical protein [Catellatospora vulcania]